VCGDKSGLSESSSIPSTVMAGFIPAIHFPETDQNFGGLWKMDGRHKGGHDELRMKKLNPASR
jgi:hypothetical protein